MKEGEAGRLIGGRYRIDQILGQGGMGYVWLGRDELLDRDVAVKEVAFPHLDDSNGGRAQREARAAARLNHPGIVTIHDLVTADGRLWIVMELVRAPSLADVVEQGGPMPADRVARIGLQVLDALSAAHRAGILHRDIKPANLLITDHRAVITDFGIAAIEGEEALTRTGLVVGTLAYMAPELTAPEDDVRQRASSASDLWALGATLHTALTGYPPRPGAGAETGPELSASSGPLTAALDGLLRDDPAARITAEQAAVLLREAAGPAAPGRPAGADSPSRAETILGVPAAVPPATPRPGDGASRGRDDRTVTQLAAVPAAGISGPVTQAATSPPTSPATFPPAAPAPAGRRIPLGIGLLTLGIVLGIASLFPEYQGFGSLASATDSLVTYSGYLVSWTAALVLIVALRGRPAFGALLGLGTAAATLGVFLIDLSVAVTSSQAHVGPGLVLALLGWLSGTAGVALLIGRSPGGWPRLPRGRTLAPAGLLVIAALGTAIAYGPTSFSYTWSGGSLISGDLYPVDWSLVTTANLFLMVIFVAAVVAAVLWVPARLGAAMAAGAIIPMAMQAVFTLVAVAEFVPPSATGDVTPAFKAYCAFIILGAIGCGWLATVRDASRPAIPEPEIAR